MHGPFVWKATGHTCALRRPVHGEAGPAAHGKPLAGGDVGGQGTGGGPSQGGAEGGSEGEGESVRSEAVLVHSGIWAGARWAGQHA